MKGYFYLRFNKDNSIIIYGERLGKNKIMFKGKLGFFDAIRFSDSSPPEDADFPSQFVPLKANPNETFHFHDPLIYKKFKLIIDHHSLIIIDSENTLTPGAVLNIFNSFLIKKGNKMLFLTNVPNNKISKRKKDNFLSQNDKQEPKQED